MTATIELKDWLIIAATGIGPILAVQAQKWVERFRARKVQKLRVFSSLMATRAARLSPDHVKALNMIDVVFYPPKLALRPGKDRAVIAAWKEYKDGLDAWREGTDQSVIVNARNDLFINLLTAMANNVGFSFDKVHLKRGGYIPQGHTDNEQENNETRRAMKEVFSGKRPLLMEITKVPAVNAPPPEPPKLEQKN